ncbi:MAG: hypothetical protein WCD77_04860 [Acidobacteriaceae bacterium]
MTSKDQSVDLQMLAVSKKVQYRTGRFCPHHIPNSRIHKRKTDKSIDEHFGLLAAVELAGKWDEQIFLI